MQSTVLPSVLMHREPAHLASGNVIGAKTFTKHREEKMPLAVVRHGIDESVLKRHLQLGNSGIGIIGIDATVCPHPVFPFLVAI